MLSVIGCGCHDNGPCMKTKRICRVLVLSSSALALAASFGGCDTSADEAQTQREGLLFGLESSDLETLQTYVPDEDPAALEARLTAPFACSQYGDLCDAIGRGRAIEYTGSLVDMALEHAAIEDIEAFSQTYLDQAMSEHAELGDIAVEDEETVIALRAATSWFSRTVGNVRLLVRNGISTPVIGARRAWTQAKTQRRNGLGNWVNRRATELCVDTGTNLQTWRVCGGGNPCETVTLESLNPAETCVSNRLSHTVSTFHERNTTTQNPGGGFSESFTVLADGCGDGELNGVSFSAVCPPVLSRTY